MFLASALPALAADTTRPSIGFVSPDQATVSVPTVFSATVIDDESGIASCRFYVDNDDAGGMDVSGTTASISYAFTQAGIHTVFVFCRDNVNNFNSGPNTSVTVGASSSGDATPPTVSAITPVAATIGVAVTFSANASDGGTGVAGCFLFVNGFSKGAMTLANGVASRSHTFDATGPHLVYAQCFDGAGNTGSGPEITVAVSAQAAAQPDLIKTACPAGAAADHPCKAVYYRGTDGKRHAFPNSRVFFTWYADFSTVQDVSAEEMSASALGKNVTYKPGSKLVKFTTLNNVYAVAKGGTLRWVKSEEVAAALYGADWNKKVDDISDVFYLDYKFGADIDTAQDYSPSSEAASTPTIEQNF